jgi:hypothetical protein
MHLYLHHNSVAGVGGGPASGRRRWMTGAASVAGVGGGSLQCPFFGTKAAASAIAYELRALYLHDSCSTRDRPVHFTVSRCGQFFPSVL